MNRVLKFIYCNIGLFYVILYLPIKLRNSLTLQFSNLTWYLWITKTHLWQTYCLKLILPSVEGGLTYWLIIKHVNLSWGIYIYMYIYICIYIYICMYIYIYINLYWKYIFYILWRERMFYLKQGYFYSVRRFLKVGLSSSKTVYYYLLQW